MKKKWANPLFIGLVIVGVFLTFPLTTYISEHPASFISKIVLTIARFSGESSARDNSAAIAFGAFFFILLTNLFLWLFFLKPLEIFGRNFPKLYPAIFRSLNPRYKTARFGWNYGMTQLLLEDLKREDLRFEEKENILRLVQERLDKMAGLDPDSPFLKEIAGEFYNIKTEKLPDTAISSELKEWKELSRKAAVEETEESGGKRNYVYVGIAILFMAGIILIGMQEIFKNGAVLKGLFYIIAGLVGGPYAIRTCLPRKKK